MQDLSAASYTLVPYDVKQLRSCAEALRKQLQISKDAHLPKKRFAFSKKAVDTSKTAGTVSHAGIDHQAAQAERNVVEAQPRHFTDAMASLAPARYRIVHHSGADSTSCICAANEV